MNECYVGDVRDGLRHWIAQGVRAQTCVTSPPYWGLRDYGTAQWDGGDAACDHMESQGGPSSKQESSAGTRGIQYRHLCGKCGARRIDKQLGLEPTIAEYVANMVDVFRLVRDVLADDGTLWLNLGDSYNTQAGAVGSRPGGGGQGDKWAERGAMTSPNRMPQAGLKPKDLCGIPWRVAFALQADGWYLRSDVIWAKPNPMPESVTDRPTKAHEYLFLLAKQERYFYDADAIKDKSSPGTHERRSIKAPDGWATHAGGHGSFHKDGREKGKTRKLAEAGSGTKNNDSFDAAKAVMPDARNKRTVWTVATEAFPEAHFATFPTALVGPCILAGSRVGDIVLDPFMGSGTVAQVAQSLGRKWIGCELNPDYVAMQKRRAAQQGLELQSA